jgi:hypothetical protein
LTVTITQQLLAGAGEGDAAGFHDVAEVGDLEGHVGVLLDEEDGEALLVDFADDVEDTADDDGGKTQGRLIHHHELRAGRECPSDSEHLLLPAGQCAAQVSVR